MVGAEADDHLRVVEGGGSSAEEIGHDGGDRPQVGGTAGEVQGVQVLRPDTGRLQGAVCQTEDRCLVAQGEPR